METPAYIFVPSVRPTISIFLSHWFVHAIEARAGSGALAELESRAEAEKNTAVRKRLEAIQSHIKARKLIGKKQFKGEIHFVIADNAAFHLEKPEEETHTPQALQLANALNSIGNRHGVYVHYIPPSEMGALFPDPIPAAHPLVRQFEGKPKTSPGAASNIALAYIRVYHESKYASPQAMLFRMDDDLIPPIGKAKWRRCKEQQRNFFSDQQKLLDINANAFDMGYHGFIGGVGEGEKPGKSLRITLSYPHPPLMGKITDVPYFSTGYGELIYKSALRQIPSPDYLLHTGKWSTYDPHDDDFLVRPSERTERYFGSYSFDERNKVEKAPEEMLRRVLEKSGISQESAATEAKGKRK